MLVILLIPLSFGLSSAGEQRVSVSGSVKCGDFFEDDVKIELFEEDFGGIWGLENVDEDDFMDGARSAVNGTFFLSGTEFEWSSIEPYVLFTHRCNAKPRCMRTNRYEIPASYIDKKLSYNMGNVRLDEVTPKSQNVCP